MDPLHQLLRWISGNPEGGVLAAAAAMAEPIFWVVRRIQRLRDSGVLDVLRSSGGDSGVGFREDQIAAQNGAGPRRVRASLRRLEKSGDVRQADGHWFVTAKGTRRGRKRRSS
jgi:hypothetical protein